MLTGFGRQAAKQGHKYLATFFLIVTPLYDASYAALELQCGGYCHYSHDL